VTKFWTKLQINVLEPSLNKTWECLSLKIPFYLIAIYLLIAKRRSHRSWHKRRGSGSRCVKNGYSKGWRRRRGSLRLDGISVEGVVQRWGTLRRACPLHPLHLPSRDRRALRPVAVSRSTDAGESGRKEGQPPPPSHVTDGTMRVSPRWVQVSSDNTTMCGTLDIMLDWGDSRRMWRMSRLRVSAERIMHTGDSL